MRNIRLLTLALLAMLGLGAQAQEDVTSQYLQNADLSTVDSGWDYYSDSYKYTAWKTDGAIPVVEFYAGWGSLEHTNFLFTQTVTLPAGDYRIAVNAFYRNGDIGDSTNPHKAWIFAGDKTQDVVGLSAAGVGAYAGSNDLYKAATAFSQGEFSNAFDFTVETESEIALGFEGKFDDIRQWCILGPVKLYKYSLDDYIADYRAKVAEAQALYDEPMNKDVLAALKASIVDEGTFHLGKEVADAISAINEQIAAAKQSIEAYKAVKEVLDAAGKLTPNGQAAYAESDVVKELQAAYDARTLTEMTAEQQQAAKDALAAAVWKQTEVGADYTPVAPTTWVGQTGNYGARAERYNDANSNFRYEGDVMTQTIEGLPTGAYKVVLEAAASFTDGRGFTAKTGDGLAAVFANKQQTNLPVVNRTGIGSDSEYGPIEVTGKVGADGVLKYGITKLDAEGGNWFVVKLVSITKVDFTPVTAINASDVTVEVTETAEIGATVTPADATFPEITYTVADEAIATVDAQGVVTGVSEGATTVTIEADDLKKDITVTVTKPAVLPTAITLSETDINLDVADNRTVTLTATVTPAEASQDVAFAISDEAVATIGEDGTVTAVGPGTATITVTSKVKDDVKATATVTVSIAEAPAIFSATIENGKEYWLCNAATGMFLGGANSWGTRASLIKHGIPFKANQVEEGIYTLDSYTSNGGNSHYLAGEWIDGQPTNLTMVANANGSYSVGIASTWEEEGEQKSGTFFLKAKTSNTEVDLVGTDVNDAFAQWYFISKADLMEGLKNASETNPVDATFFIKDFNLSRNNTQYSAWQTNNVANAQTPWANENHYNWNCESYHKLFSMSQLLGLPNGTYRLKAQGFYRQDGEDNENLAVLFANDQQTPLLPKTGTENSMNDAAASFSKGLYTLEPITVEVTDHCLKIGVKNEVNESLWCIWDNFELEMIGMSDEQGLPVEIKQAGYATLYYSNLNLKAAEGVGAFLATTSSPTTMELIPVADNVIPSGTAVVLKGEPATYQFEVIYDDVEAQSSELLGIDEETTIKEEGFKYYMLSQKNGKNTAFYFQTEDGSQIVNGAHRGYLRREATQNAPMMISFSDPTGISEVSAAQHDGETYTISGVRVDSDHLQKGLYIVNGKKVVVK